MEAQQRGMAALSSALTFPLTLVRAWRSLLPNEEPADGWRIGVIGARAEVALPGHVWSELSTLTGAKRVNIEFSGPAAAPEGVPSAREWLGGHHPQPQQLHLTLASADLYHRSEVGKALLARSRADAEGAAPPAAAADPALPLPDAFVLYNPGLGEPGWDRAWAPTMRALLAARRPLLMTALSAADAARDALFLEGLKWGANGPPARLHEPFVDNPFASLLNASGERQASGGEARANACGRVLSV